MSLCTGVREFRLNFSLTKLWKLRKRVAAKMVKMNEACDMIERGSSKVEIEDYENKGVNNDWPLTWSSHGNIMHKKTHAEFPGEELSDKKFLITFRVIKMLYLYHDISDL